jgi:hypothetical protein
MARPNDTLERYREGAGGRKACAPHPGAARPHFSTARTRRNEIGKKWPSVAFIAGCDGIVLAEVRAAELHGLGVVALPKLLAIAVNVEELPRWPMLHAPTAEASQRCGQFAGDACCRAVACVRETAHRETARRACAGPVSSGVSLTQVGPFHGRLLPCAIEHVGVVLATRMTCARSALIDSRQMLSGLRLDSHLESV